ncbi:MAG TPA: ROK family protein [Acidimicrobiales bacterium]
MTTVLAVDIGGTKLAAAVVDEDGALGERRTVPTPDSDDAEEVWAALADLVGPAGGLGVSACGVGCGGPMEPGGEAVSPLNIGAWRGFPLRDRLAAATGVPVFVDNDAKALALGEGWRGAAAGVRDFIAMVVSTGVGGGIVLDGRLLDGAAGNAGHIGHVIVEPSGEWCRCGARGCLEAMASGPSIARMTGRAPEEAGASVRRRTGRLVGRAVADVANLLDLRLAVVGGSVALGFGAEFFAAAQAELDARARISFSAGARIVPAGLGDAGPLVGAAAVALRGLGVSLLGGDGGGDAVPGAGRRAGQ